MDNAPRPISERARECTFWWLPVFVLLLACTSPQRLARVPWPFAEEPSRLVMAVVIIAAAPTAILVELRVEVVVALGRARLPRLGWFKRNATAAATHAVPLPPAAAAAQVAQRLEALGFTHTTHAAAGETGAMEVRAAKAADAKGFAEDGTVIAEDAVVLEYRLTPSAFAALGAAGAVDRRRCVDAGRRRPGAGAAMGPRPPRRCVARTLPLPRRFTRGGRAPITTVCPN